MMKKNIGLVLYYSRENRYSFNALVGAIETEDDFEDLKIYFIYNAEELVLKLRDIIEQHEMVIVGISFMTTQLWYIDSVMRKLRERYRNKVLYLAGGPHPSGDPYGTLKMGFDLVVLSDGEETMLELIKRIDNDEDYHTIEGIAFMDDDGEYHFTHRSSRVILDNYPPFAVKHSRFGPIEITRGCPFGCYFCQTTFMFGHLQRHRSIDNICKYVEVLKNKGLDDIRFVSPDALSYGSQDGKNLCLTALEELLANVKKIIKSSGGRVFVGTFPSEVRPEHVTEETISLLSKYADNDNLVIGAQSGSERMLRLSHRGHTVEDIYRAVRLAVKANFTANVDFIFGLPGETEEDMLLTIKVMRDLIRMGARIHAHTFVPLPQTPFMKSPPGKIDNYINEFVKQYISKGVIYGNWREQEAAAKKIAAYFSGMH
jgi:B12-binding domain/radical SAM domain protein